MKTLFGCNEDERDFCERQKFELRGAAVGQGGDGEVDFPSEYLFDGLLGGAGGGADTNVSIDTPDVNVEAPDVGGGDAPAPAN